MYVGRSPHQDSQASIQMHHEIALPMIVVGDAQGFALTFSMRVDCRLLLPKPSRPGREVLRP